MSKGCRLYFFFFGAGERIMDTIGCTSTLGLRYVWRGIGLAAITTQHSVYTIGPKGGIETFYLFISVHETFPYFLIIVLNH